MNKIFTILIISLFIFSCDKDDNPIEPIEEEPFICVDEYVMIDGVSYYQCDIDVLQKFIDISSTSINTDMDKNGNSIIEPLELGTQEWNDGRINYLLFSMWDEESDTIIFSNYHGEIPIEIKYLQKLEYLNFIGTNLTGEVPIEIGDLVDLTYLNIEGQQLTGGIPIDVGNLINLRTLRLDGNDFSGEIPIELGQLLNLFTLNLSDNNLTGEIPNEFSQLTDINVLDLHNNQLSGEIPEILGSIIELNLVNNKFCPPYPSFIESNFIDTQNITDCVGEMFCQGNNYNMDMSDFSFYSIDYPTHCNQNPYTLFSSIN